MPHCNQIATTNFMQREQLITALLGCCTPSLAGMTMPLQILAPRFVFAVLAFNCMMGVIVHSTRAYTAEVPASCTIFPRDMWLPLRTIVDRLEDDGWVVLRRGADTQDCYRINARDPDGHEKLLVIDPVSGKVRREQAE